MRRNTTDEELIKRFVQGHQAALATLADRYGISLLGLASGLLDGNEALARDAVQETWLRVIRFGDRFNGRSRFKTWLYRIAINQCNSLRSARPPNAPREHLSSQPSGEDGPARVAEKADRADTLRVAVEQLHSDQRLVVLMCYHEGMTHAQAAEILDIPIGTLKSRLHAALTELRQRLPPETRP